MSQFLAAVGPWAPFVIFLLATAESAAFLGFIIPGEVAVILGGVAAGTGSVSLWIMIVASVTGAIVGDSVGYRLGSRLGPVILTRQRYAKFASHLSTASRVVAERGWWALVLARFTAVLRAVVPFAAGMGAMPYRRFLLGNVIGGVAWGTTFTFVGFVAGANYPVFEKWFRTGGLALVVLGILVGGIIWATRWIGRNRQRSTERVQRLLRRRPLAYAYRRVSGPNLVWTLSLSGVLIGLSVWLFAGLVQDILGREEFFFFDRAAISYFDSNRLGWWISTLKVINSVTATPVIVALAAVVGGYHLYRRRVRVALALFAVMSGQWLIVEAVEPIINRLPPQVVPIATRSNCGFPSEHVAALVALLVVVLWPWSQVTWRRAVRRAGTALIFLTLVMTSRVVLLVEYPSDVLAGMAVGTAWSLVATLAFDRFRKTSPRAEPETWVSPIG